MNEIDWKKRAHENLKKNIELHGHNLKLKGIITDLQMEIKRNEEITIECKGEQRIGMSSSSIFKILGRYGKLTGTIEKPLFSDRQTVKEILEVSSK